MQLIYIERAYEEKTTTFPLNLNAKNNIVVFLYPYLLLRHKIGRSDHD